MPVPFKLPWKPRLGYIPSAPITGDAADYVFRGLNMILRGSGGMTHLEGWRGHKAVGFIGSHVALTGIASTSGSVGFPNLTGTGTKFVSELILGQSILYNSQVFVVRKLVSDVAIEVDPAIPFVANGLPIYYLPKVQEVDTSRATYIRGSVIRLARGHYLGVGAGAVKLDEQPLAGSGWTLRNHPSLALYDVGSGNYSPFKLGMKKPTLTTVINIAGGTKQMVAGTYSVRVVPARIATNGYNQTSEAIQVTIATNEKIRITFPAMDTSAGQDSWRIYGSLGSTGEGVTGPWYLVDTVTTTQVSSGGGTYDFEWRDAEISGTQILEFDNDAAPAATFIATLGGLPILIGTNGPGRTLTGTVVLTNGSATVAGTGTTFDTQLAVDNFVYINSQLYKVLSITSATSMTVTPTPIVTTGSVLIRSANDIPGPVLRPAKLNNIEAFPARAAVAINPPETILGYVEGIGRLYLMTRNRLHIAVLSGDLNVPVVTRPFWKIGFRNDRALVFVNGYLYAFTTKGATRSAGDGDGVAEEHNFAAPVSSDMARWEAAKVTVAYDPENEAICYIHADDGVNENGRRYSTVLMYMLTLGVWSPPLRIESKTTNIAAVSAATVNGSLSFVGATAAESNIHEWDKKGTTLKAYVATPFIDLGAEGQDKAVRGLSITAKAQRGITAEIYGASAEEDIPVAELETGADSRSGPITFTMGGAESYGRTTRRAKLNVRRNRVLAVRIELPLAQSAIPARLDEIVLDGNITRHTY